MEIVGPKRSCHYTAVTVSVVGSASAVVFENAVYPAATVHEKVKMVATVQMLG